MMLGNVSSDDNQIVVPGDGGIVAAMVDQAKKARVIKANTILQAKVGLGPLDNKVLDRCEDVMENNKIDFAPVAREYLMLLEDSIQQTREGKYDHIVAIESMTGPVMQLKAHASMFRYTLVGKLANIMLSFLESVEAIDDDVISIVEAHHRTLKTIVMKKLSGDGGAGGETLKAELTEAIRRYNHKRGVH